MPANVLAQGMKLLFDLRPALEGFAGVPQETRLLFAALAGEPDLALTGLVQGARGTLAPASTWGDRMALVHAVLRQPGIPLRSLPTAGREDELWSLLFAKTLPAQARERVTRAPLRRLASPRTAMQLLGLATGLVGPPRYAHIDTSDFDILLAQTAYPGCVAPGTRLVVRYFDSIPITMPHTVKHGALHGAMHRNALHRNADDGAWFVCCSEATQADLLALRPDLESRCSMIPCMLSHHFHDAPASPEQRARLLPRGDFLLMVSTLEPRKNHLTLLAAWEQLRASSWPDLQLVIVGGAGWKHQPILQRMRPWQRKGCLHWLQGVPSDDLRLLYRHALATVAPSLGEGFDYAGVEAMRSGGLVVASDIRVHRDVYTDAAEYFDPHSAADLAARLSTLLAPAAAARRQALRQAGEAVSARYLPGALVPQWQQLLARVMA